MTIENKNPEVNENDFELDTEFEFDTEEFEVENDDEQMENADDEQRDDEPNEQDDEQRDEKAEDAEKDQEKQQEKEVNKTVPFSALEAERKKWQERVKELSRKAAIADRLSQSTGKDIDALNDELDALEVQRHVEAGVDPQMAQYIVQQQRQMAELSRTLNKQKYDIEVAQLKQDPFFRDIEDVRDELEAFAERTGLTLQQAYMATRGPQRMVEYAREVEQRVLNNLSKKPKKVDTGPSGEVQVKPKVNLTKEELEIAKMAGMTPQEYYNLKKVQSPDQYRKLKQK